MLAFHWALFGIALLIALTHGALITSVVKEGTVKYIDEAQRSKRSYRRGQTQSQYLNFGQPELDGKAEAEATENGSRSTVSGTHGMGQAQSQFSSGDCSGCNTGSPVYEYSTESPDPLTLGGNTISYSDSKPSSILGFPGTTSGRASSPGAQIDGAFTSGAGVQVGRSGAVGDLGLATGGPFAPVTGVQVSGPGVYHTPGISSVPAQSGSTSGFLPPIDMEAASRSEGAFAPGMGTIAGQLAQPELSSGFAVGKGAAGAAENSHTFAPGVGIAPGNLEQPILSRDFATGRRVAEEPGTGTFTPGINAVQGHQGQPRPSSAFVPGRGIAGAPRTSSFPSGIGAAPMLGQPDINSGFGPAVVLGTSHNFPSDVGIAPGQTVQPGISRDFTPNNVIAGAPEIHDAFTPRSENTGQIGLTDGGIEQSDIGQPRQRPQLIASPAGQVQGQQPRMALLPQVHNTYLPGGSFTPPGSGKQQVPQYTSDGHQAQTYWPDSRRPADVPIVTGKQAQPSGQPIQQLTQPGTFYKLGSTFTTGQQQVPQYITDQQVVSGYGQPTSGGVQPGTGPQQILQRTEAGIRPGVASFRQNTDGNFGQTANVGKGVVIRPQPGSVLQSVYRTQPSVGYGQPGRDISPGIKSNYQPDAGVNQGHIPPNAGLGQPDVRVHQSHIPGIGYSQPESAGQQRFFQPSEGLAKPGPGVQTAFGKSSPEVQPSGVSNAQTDAGHFQPGAVMQRGINYRQEGTALSPESIYGQIGYTAGTSNAAEIAKQGLLAQPIQGQIGVGYQHGLEAFDPQSGKTGTRTPQASSNIQKNAGFIPGFPPPERSAQIGPSSGFEQEPQKGQQDGHTQRMFYGQLSSPTLGSLHPSVGYVQPNTATQKFQQPSQPNAGAQSGLMFDQHQGGRQANAQPGFGFVQYPSADPSHLPAPAGGLQQDSLVQKGTRVQQGTGTQQGIGTQQGSNYDTIYSQPPGGQAVPGYRQPNPAIQYSQPGYGTQGTELQPGFMQPEIIQRGQGSPGSTQYSHGPQHIVQTDSAYVPTVVQRGIAESGGLVSGISGIDDAFSQAESSIGNGQAAASAQGKKNGGTAKTQVQGTYSSSGSFSASAMTSDNDRSASSQVTGGIDGAMSQSQGQGGAAQSQAQVQVNEKSGGTKASSQSGGIIHQSQSEVQSNDKGGVADAQSSGPGQTSSQAQIGFRPGQDGEIVRSAGGGQASAQSGAHSGNSQSQIQGTSKYGVSYHGAAQSASGTKEQVATYREQNRDLFNTISQFGNTDAVTDRVEAIYNPALISESDTPDLQLKAARTNKEATNSNKVDDNSISPDEEEEEEPYDEYDDEEDYYNENPIKMESKTTGNKKLEASPLYRTHTHASPTQIQQVTVADPTKKYNVVQNQNGRVQKYPTRTTTETVPSGFRGTVNVEKKFHTKSLEPHKSENKLNTTVDEKSGNSPRTPNSFVTVTKSITGSMDNSKNPPQENKNFQSTYYTKSSTCGYFTFSCNIVYGANGRSKICRPKAPANGKC